MRCDLHARPFTVCIWVGLLLLVGWSFADPTPSASPATGAGGQVAPTVAISEIVIAGLIALVVGAGITGLELLTSKYPNTISFARRSHSFLLYVLVYGVLAGMVTTFASQLGLTFHQNSPYLRAVEVGIGVKAFLHINLFSVPTSATTTFPVGVESIVQIFEPKLLRGILLDEFTLISAYLQPKVEKYPDPAKVKGKITGSVPTALSAAEKTAFLTDLEVIIPNALPGGYNAPAGINRAMELYLRLVGKKLVDQVFP